MSIYPSYGRREGQGGPQTGLGGPKTGLEQFIKRQRFFAGYFASTSVCGVIVFDPVCPSICLSYIPSA